MHATLGCRYKFNRGLLYNTLLYHQGALCTPRPDAPELALLVELHVSLLLATSVSPSHQKESTLIADRSESPPIYSQGPLP